MATAVSICSNALVLLGSNAIASFTEGTKGARTASNLYPDARQAFLRSHPWNAATRRVQLAPQAAPPAFGWRSSFLLPRDCLRVINVQFGDQSIEHKVEGRAVMADVTTINLEYITDLAEDLWDPAMVAAMTAQMAGLMAYTMTASASMADQWAQTAERRFRQAKTTDGQEGTPEAIDDDPFMRSRFAGGGF